MDKFPVALLGLGIMGQGMAANLLKAGFPLTVWNRTASRAEPFAAQGARVASTPAEAAKGAKLILSMLADDNAAREAWLGENGALAAAEPGAILAESTTASPAWIRELAEAAGARGLELLDAPVTGSRPQAQAGQLKFLVGGSAEALAAIQPAMDAMGQQAIHLGPIGSGATMKLLNNFLCGIQLASLAEGVAWLERSSLNRDAALGLLKTGVPGSPMIAGMADRMTGDLDTVNFALALLDKDLSYAHAAAAETGVELSTAANARQLFGQAIAAGYGGRDMASVVEVVRRS